MQDAVALRQIKSRYRSLGPLLDERLRRQWAATEAQAYGRGGMSAVSCVIGMSRNTIRKGLAELTARKRNPKAVVGTRLRDVQSHHPETMIKLFSRNVFGWSL